MLVRSLVPVSAAGALLATLACGRDPSSDAPRDAGVTRAAGGEVTGAAPARPQAGASAGAAAAASRPACAPDNDGLRLPAGFCATVFVDSLGAPRHLAVAPNGDVFVALQAARRRTANESGQGGKVGVLALRDTDGDGRADVRERFGEAGGTGIAVAPGWVYVDEGTEIVRYPVAGGRLVPSGAKQVVLSGLPMTGHNAHNLLLDGRGALFVNIGSATNSCQQADRQSGSPGDDPCAELTTRAGVWRYDANRTGQRFSPAERWFTGNRNAMGLAFDPRDGALYATQHGRDQLFQNWGQRFTTEQSAELPAEELQRVTRGADFGWPYCYYDQRQQKRVLAPEYGGDGREVGRCAGRPAPVAAFPGHWAPMSLLFYTGRQFPARYRDGAFIAFHGSWNRAPLPQAGYRVSFVPFAAGQAAGTPETFVDGFAGTAELRQPGQARHRPAGLAAAPDGGMYVTDDAGGRIWKIVYVGDSARR
jgi:glucose/arabinose dehydrogenase